MVRKTSGRNPKSLNIGGCKAATDINQGTRYFAFTIWSLNSRFSGWLSKRYVLRFESLFYIWSLLNKPNQIFIFQLLFLLRLIINFLITSSPTIRSLPAAHHGEVCDYQSSVGSYCSQYITISSSFTDAFLPSSLHNTSIRQSFHQVCYRRCLIAETSPSEATTATSQCLSRR